MSVKKLLKAEAIKLRRRSAFTLAVFIAVVFVLMMLAGTVYASRTTNMQMTLPRFWNEVFEVVAQIVVFFSVVTVVNLTAAEYGWRTSRQNVIDGLSREQWYSAKAMLVPLVPLLFFLLSWGLIIPVVGLFAESRDPFITAGQVRGLGALLLSGIGLSSLGLFASFLTRNTAGAIAVVLGWISFGEGLVALGLMRIDRSYVKYAQYLPGQIFRDVGELRRWAPDMFRGRRMSIIPDELPNETVLLFTIVYIILFLAASFALVRRQDL